MPWIRQIAIEDATGVLKRAFDAALARAGRVWNIVHVMSLNPRVLTASIDHYAAIMHAPSPLSRVQRELLATVVSAEVGCHY
jgi:alkylhydroperoxidase family enzyme